MMEKKNNEFATKLELPEDCALGSVTDDDKRLLRKIDRKILPIMFLTYFLQMIDKISINVSTGKDVEDRVELKLMLIQTHQNQYANVMGLQADLGMHGNDFSWLATAFFIAYALAEIPQGALLQRFPVSKVLGANVFCWGIILCCSSAVQNFSGMLALRILLGLMEAVIGELQNIQSPSGDDF
jgi:MFS family permease